MNLAKAPPAYSADDQQALRKALSDADADNLKRRQDTKFLNGEKVFYGTQYGVTAHAGGGKASAVALTAQIVHIGTCATAADSVLLFPAKRGVWCFIRNQGAAASQVFGQGTDTINGVATATGVSQGASTGRLYFSPKDGEWYTT